ncbi:MAG: hypothetical protein HC868_05660 [Sphingomonadales bacterium]|nr:hypothetical protein [Sphingomonadales bacterium]
MGGRCRSGDDGLGAVWTAPGSSSIDQPYDASFAKQWEANPPKGYPTLSPENLNAMKAAIKRYSDVVDRGGWKAMPEGQIQPGANGPNVALLRERLTMSGDLKEGEGYFSEVYDGTVEKAVKRFQASNGLTPSGIVDKRTVAALNVPAAARLRQLKTNYTRLAEFARSTGKNTSSSTFRRSRSKWSRTIASCRGTRVWSARWTGRRQCCARPSTS